MGALDSVDVAADAVGIEPIRGRPPEEADPRLWTLLTRAERDFYFRNATFSALTYGPNAGSEGSSHPGRRLGARVDLTA